MERDRSIKFSIVIPFYNTKEEYLNECIDREIKQSYDNVEILLINDGSDLEYSNLPRDKRIRLFNEKHVGVSHARNVGICESNGDYILFVDSDDKLCQNACIMFKNIIALNNPIDIILSRNYINDSEHINSCGFSESKFLTDKRELLKSILVKNNSSFSSVDTPWAKVYRRDFLVKNNLFFNENLTNGEDGIFNYEAFLNADSIYYLNAPTYIYRINDNSVCNTFSTDLDARFIRLITEYEKMFKKYNICDENFNVFSIRILDRLLRKFYSFLSSDDFNKKIYEHYDFFEKYYKDYYSDFVTDYFKKRISLEHLKIKR